MEKMRLLPIKNAYNFRDIGGYIGYQGRIIKWRKLLRSGDFSELSEADKTYLSDIPLLTVVDFRSEKEVATIPDSLPVSVKNVYNFHIDAGNLVPQFKMLIDNNSFSEEEVFVKAVNLLEDLYRQLVTDYNDAYKNFFQVLQAEETPLLFHCTAGKDRTGIAAALVLSALGVDRSVIFEDYLLTNSALQGKYDYLKDFGSIVTLFKSVKREFLESAFNMIDENYGSMENYLVRELDVNLEKIRNLYLM